MARTALFAFDVIAIIVMVFVLYFPRHRRRDMVVAYLVVNIGVLAVADALATTELNAGLGLGLFGVLSIIRLRSAELDQAEVAYFFAALALGLLGGLSVTPASLTPVLMIGILVALAVGDHERLLGRYRSTTLTLDRAYTDEVELRNHLAGLLRATIHRVNVRRVDLVNDTTVVEVRYALDPVDASSTPDARHPSARAIGSIDPAGAGAR